MQDQNIDGGRAFDWGLASGDYAKYRDIYPEQLYQTLYELGIGLPGQQVLDIGTGTGVLPRYMARYGAQFTGLDMAQEQLLQARAMTRAAGLSIAYVEGDANDPPFPADAFDCITAAQCWQYLNPERAIPAFHRILKPGGLLAIVYMAWLPDENPVVRRSIALVRRFNPGWDGYDSRLQYADPPWCGESVRPAGYRTLDVLLPFTRESWNGRMRACRGVGASLAPDAVEAFHRAHLKLLEETMPERFLVRHELAIQLFQFL
ncbi:MAG TPA: methyltransferase domain-containing protein [Candidatus Fimivicinus intestinavium]|nr:methyltransferase domain-containing protein [Candidatus Fimivicinus intestinavium]